MGKRRFVVIDGREGERYDDIITVGGAKIIFDSADTLRYFAQKGSDICSVKEKIE